eukprot:TRINITY_DN14931_c0_g1_i1.p1 TRINITY_DN14931_c0_g1~~TRINITY_DN14931_c0_g1_i1.p1  ORF type:complete len:437 (-),score=60.93 TRINITY_DN14931_c0_g1_i1:316-1605(-)
MIAKWSPYSNFVFGNQDAATHANGLVSKLCNSRDKGDFEFRAGDKVLRAHSVVVSACSPVFEAMLTSQMIEARTSSVELVDVESATVEAMIRFAYLGDLVVEPLAIPELLQLAHQYQMCSLVERCCATMTRHVNARTAVPFLRILRLLSEKPSELQSPTEEMKAVAQLMKMPLKAGSNYCLVSKKWYAEWQQWVGHGQCGNQEACNDQQAFKRQRTESQTKKKPGPIDNSELLEEGPQERIKNLCEFEIVPESVWKLLYSRYGGGPLIKRRAIQVPSGAVEVQLYGTHFGVYLSSSIKEAELQVVEASQMEIGVLSTYLCSDMNLDPQKVRAWDYCRDWLWGRVDVEGERHRTLADLTTYSETNILLELQNADGTWSYEESTTPSYAGCICYSSREIGHEVPPTTRAFGAISKTLAMQPDLLMATLMEL